MLVVGERLARGRTARRARAARRGSPRCRRPTARGGRCRRRPRRAPRCVGVTSICARVAVPGHRSPPPVATNTLTRWSRSPNPASTSSTPGSRDRAGRRGRAGAARRARAEPGRGDAGAARGARMRPFARHLARAGGDDGLAVWSLQYRVRGWNGADRSPVADAEWALDQVDRPPRRRARRARRPLDGWAHRGARGRLTRAWSRSSRSRRGSRRGEPVRARSRAAPVLVVHGSSTPRPARACRWSGRARPRRSPTASGASSCAASATRCCGGRRCGTDWPPNSRLRPLGLGPLPALLAERHGRPMRGSTISAPSGARLDQRVNSWWTRLAAARGEPAYRAPHARRSGTPRRHPAVRRAHRRRARRRGVTPRGALGRSRGAPEQRGWRRILLLRDRVRAAPMSAAATTSSRRSAPATSSARPRCSRRPGAPPPSPPPLRWSCSPCSAPTSPSSSRPRRRCRRSSNAALDERHGRRSPPDLHRTRAPDARPAFTATTTARLRAFTMRP